MESVKQPQLRTYGSRGGVVNLSNTVIHSLATSSNSPADSPVTPNS